MISVVKEKHLRLALFNSVVSSMFRVKNKYSIIIEIKTFIYDSSILKDSKYIISK